MLTNQKIENGRTNHLLTKRPNLVSDSSRLKFITTKETPPCWLPTSFARTPSSAITLFLVCSSSFAGEPVMGVRPDSACRRGVIPRNFQE